MFSSFNVFLNKQIESSCTDVIIVKGKTLHDFETTYGSWSEKDDFSINLMPTGDPEEDQFIRRKLRPIYRCPPTHRYKWKNGLRAYVYHKYLQKHFGKREVMFRHEERINSIDQKYLTVEYLISLRRN